MQGGTGSLLESAIYTTGFANTVNGNISTSLFYKGQSVSGPDVRLGIVGTTSSVIHVTDPTEFFWVEHYGHTNVALINGSTGYSLSNSTVVDTTHWTKLELDVANLGSGNFEVDVLLQDFGTSGMAPPVTLFSMSQVLANSSAAAASSFYAGFGAQSGSIQVDNFTAVPEPGALTLAVLALVSVLCVARLRPHVLQVKSPARR